MKVLEEHNEESPNILIDEATRADLDSDEEYYFMWFLQELKDAGVILKADVNHVPIDLSIKIEHGFELIHKKKSVRKRSHVFNPTIYTPDFNIEWNVNYRDVIYSNFINGKQFPGQKIPFLTFDPFKHGSIIEVKGDFDANRTKGQTMVKMKWVFEKYQAYIQMVIIPDLFKTTFTPKKFLAREPFFKEVGPKGKKETKRTLPPKTTWPVKTIEQYMEELELARTKIQKHNEQSKIDLLPTSEV